MKEHCHTRHTLLLRAKNQGDQVAWDEFVEQYSYFIRSVLLQLRINSSDIDDLSQDILLEIWKALPGYVYDKGRARFRTWLHRLIYNTVLNHIKKNRRLNNKHSKAANEKEVRREITNESAIDEIIQKEWEENIIKLALENITSLFSKNAINVFLMSLKGIKTNEICQELKLTPNAVIKLKNRVKSRLFEEINHLKKEMDAL